MEKKSAYASLQEAYAYAASFQEKKGAYETLQDGYKYAEEFREFEEISRQPEE